MFKPDAKNVLQKPTVVKTPKKIFFLAAFVQTIWASAQVVMKAIGDEINTVIFVFIRIASSVVLLAILFYILEWRIPSKRQKIKDNLSKHSILMFFIVGASEITINQNLISWGYKYAPLTIGSLVAGSLVPVFSMFFGSIMGIDRVSKIKLVGMLLGIGGVAVSMNPKKIYDDVQDGSMSDTLKGTLIIFINTLQFSIGANLQKKYLTMFSPVVQTVGMNFVGFLLAIPITAPLIPKFWREEMRDIPAWVYALAIYSGIVVSSLGFFIHGFALRRCPSASLYMSFNILQSIFGGIFAVIIFDEVFTGYLVGGSIIIFSSLLMIVRENFLQERAAKRAAEGARVEMVVEDDENETAKENEIQSENQKATCDETSSESAAEPADVVQGEAVAVSEAADVDSEENSESSHQEADEEREVSLDTDNSDIVEDSETATSDENDVESKND